MWPINKEINKIINNRIKKKISQNIDEMAEEINKKTFVYLTLSVLSLALILFPFPKIIFYILFLAIFLALCYLLWGLTKALRRFLALIDKLEQNIQSFVQKEIDKTKDQSLKNQLAWQFSSYNVKDIENLCLSYSARQIVRQFKKKKRSILIRVIAYTVTILLFKEIFLMIF